MKRFILAFACLMFAVTPACFGQQYGRNFNLVIINGRDDAILVNSQVPNHYQHCTPGTTEFGELLSAKSQKRFLCAINDNYQQGTVMFDLMTSGGNNYLCHLYWSPDNGVEAGNITGSCGVSKDGGTATVFVH